MRAAPGEPVWTTGPHGVGETSTYRAARPLPTRRTTLARFQPEQRPPCRLRRDRLYMGSEQQYQEYRKLAQQKAAADEARWASEDAREGWGYWGLWPWP
jgi:hypothetical protein